jgi:ABC-type multidrug transport system ATPase subunit
MITHFLGVAESMCRRVGIVQTEKMIAVGTIKQLLFQTKQ